MRVLAVAILLAGGIATASARAQTMPPTRVLSCQQDSCSVTCLTQTGASAIELSRVIVVTITQRGDVSHLDIRRTAPAGESPLVDFFIIGPNHACHFAGMN